MLDYPVKPGNDEKGERRVTPGNVDFDPDSDSDFDYRRDTNVISWEKIGKSDTGPPVHIFR